MTDRLLGQLDVAAVTTGRDFRFGHRRQGDIELLRAMLGADGRAVSAVDPVTVDGGACSSTAIRHGARRRAGRARQRAAGLRLTRSTASSVRATGAAATWASPPPTSIRSLGGPSCPAIGVYAVDAAIAARRRLALAPGRRQFRPAPDLRRPHPAARGPSARGRRRSLRPAAAGRVPPASARRPSSPASTSSRRRSPATARRPAPFTPPFPPEFHSDDHRLPRYGIPAAHRLPDEGGPAQARARD